MTTATGLPYLPGFTLPSPPSASTTAPQTTPQQTSPTPPITTTTSYLPGPYAQALEITSCATPIEPAFTSLLANGTVTSFATVGCQTSLPLSESAAASAVGTCKPDFQTFTLPASSGGGGVCCPSAWGTSTLGNASLYCYTSTSTATSGTGAMTNAKRNSQLFSTVMLQDVVFALAGSVTSSSSSTASVTTAPTAGGASASASAAATTTSTKSGAARVGVGVDRVMWLGFLVGAIGELVYL